MLHAYARITECNIFNASQYICACRGDFHWELFLDLMVVTKSGKSPPNTK